MHVSTARGSDYAIMRALWDAENEQHQAALSYTQLADLARICPRAARYAIARLCQAKEIIKHARAGGKSKNLYELLARPPLTTTAATGVDLRKSPARLSTPILHNPQNQQRQGVRG